MSPVCQIEMTLPWGFPGVSGVSVRLMSDRELRRLEVLQDLDRRRLTTAAAGQLLGLPRRQVFRLLKVYRIEGPTGLISKLVVAAAVHQRQGINGRRGGAPRRALACFSPERS